MPESRAELIRDAADELGFSDTVVELSVAEAAALRGRIERQHLAPGMDWWWERMRSGVAFWIEMRGWQPADTLAELCQDRPVWLLPVYDDNGEAFRTPMPVAVDILRHTALDEYALVADDLSWMIVVNHHDTIFGTGEPVATQLARRLQRPGARGEIFPGDEGA